MTTWTMSEARQRFRELLDRAGSGLPTRITRHGRVVAVVVAPTSSGCFTQALRRFRASTDTAGLLSEELDSLRDATPGRPVEL